MEEKEIQALVMAGVDKEVNLRPLNGFKLDFSANPGFKKVFFSASCDCGTAALLSLEVSEEKTDIDISNLFIIDSPCNELGNLIKVSRDYQNYNIPSNLINEYSIFIIISIFFNITCSISIQ